MRCPIPVHEFRCRTPFCTEHGIVFEVRIPSGSSDPKCPECLMETERIASRFAAPWTGTLDRYNKSGCETHNPCDGGHIQYRVRSSRLANGAPEPVRITNRQEQREFCRAEGLTDPTDVNPNVQPNEDGMWANTSGFAGQWGGTPATMTGAIKQASTWRTVVDGIAYRSAE